ncbi:MAG: [NiFe]-hydrogenase assembly chaperone HybE [Zoogloeaceae bacterium]|jgi:[NiFe] hydrogenase assembly HybE family chaperone|nr:[NiFe]-hydrogenase assembly chaperone HybE [Zoogloeaceae bacterium]
MFFANDWTAFGGLWKNPVMRTVSHALNPEASLTRVFRRIAAGGMADMPLGNPALDVEAVGFRQTENGRWLGVLITPWAMNLLLLPASDARAPWPDKAAGDTHVWRFPSGAYTFLVAAEEELGIYHLCSLFSPPHQFTSQEAARQTACAVLSELLSPPRSAALAREAASGERVSGKNRRAFLGLR